MKEYRLIFWDFDGVIKDSVAEKGAIFVKLFQPFGAEITARIAEHHAAHGGVSRYEKIPLYLTWAGQAVSPQMVTLYCDRFAAVARKVVIDAPWVPGAESYLRSNPNKQTFVLVSATPQGELESILAHLDLTRCFAEIHGAPTPKYAAIRTTLKRMGFLPESALMIGDAATDFEAAKANNVAFLLRRGQHNADVMKKYNGPTLEGFDGFR